MVAVKQLGAEVAIECPDGPAQGGLGDKELVGASAEVQVIADGQEVADLVQVDLRVLIHVAGRAPLERSSSRTGN